MKIESGKQNDKKPAALPSASTLATYAALLADKNVVADPSGDQWRPYLEKALQLYLEAVEFRNELKDLSNEELLIAHGGTETIAKHVLNPALQCPLMLKGRTSPALKYISERWGRAKSPNTVVKNIKEIFGEKGEKHLDHVAIYDKGKIIGYDLDHLFLYKLIKELRAKRSRQVKESQTKKRSAKKKPG